MPDHEPREDEDRRLGINAMARAARAELAPSVRRATLHDVKESPGDWIGRYRLVSRLGEGGMGTVWEAEQSEPVKRRVALKVIKLGMDTAEVVSRFHAERQAVAIMDHPGIAAVHDAGSTDAGRPFFVMELVEGPPLLRYCASRDLSLDQRLQLFGQVCSAVQHAHQKGVIHRDIKSSNVLVTETDGEPRIKVIDFGIAKAVGGEGADQERQTARHEIIGTLESMAPEQTGTGEPVDTRADVWGLGVLLYELLTHRRPFEAPGDGETSVESLVRMVREVDPPRPSRRMGLDGDTKVATKRVRDAMQDDLDWVVLKALEKDPDRRYAGASELGAEVQRFLAGEAIEARPPSRSYRLTKFVRRNRGAVAAGAATLLALVAGGLGTAFGLVKALDANEQLVAANERITRERGRAEESGAILSGMLTGVAPRLSRGKDTELLLGILDNVSARLLAGEIEDPYVAADLDLAIGQGLDALGQFEEAGVHLERAAESRRELNGDADAGTLQARRVRADNLRRSIEIEAAEAEYRSVIAASESLDSLHPEQIRARAGLGVTLHRAGRVPEALEELELALSQGRQVWTGAELVTRSALLDMATLQFSGLRRPEEAEALLTEAMTLAEEHLEPDHPAALRAQELLSQVYAATGRFDRSLETLDVIRVTFQEIYGPDHREMLLFEGNRSVTMQRAGMMAESEPLARATLAGMEASLGEDDPDTLWMALQVAIHDATAGRHLESMKSLRSIVRKVEASGVPAIEERYNLAVVYRDMGEPAQSCTELERVLGILEQQYPDEHPLVMGTLSELALSYEANAQPDKAAKTRARLAIE